MSSFIDEIQKRIQSKTVPINNTKLKYIVESCSLFTVSDIVDNEKNPDLFDKLKKSQFISINAYKKEEDLFFIISFEQTIIIVHKNSISFLKNLLMSPQKLTVCFDESTKLLFDSSIRIEYEKTELLFEDSLVAKYIIEKSKNSFFIKILSSILRYLVKKSLIKSSKKNRINEFYMKHCECKIYAENEFVRLHKIGRGSSFSAQLIFLIESEEILVIKEPNDLSVEAVNLQNREINNYKKFNNPFIPRFYGFTTR